MRKQLKSSLGRNRRQLTSGGTTDPQPCATGRAFSRSFPVLPLSFCEARGGTSDLLFPRAPGTGRLGTGCEVQCPGRIAGVLCRSPCPTVPADPWVFVSQRVGGHHGDAAASAPQPLLRSLGFFPPSLCCRCCGCGFPRLCGGSGTAFKCLRPRFPGIRMGPPPAAVYQRVKMPRVCGEGCWGTHGACANPSVRSQ